MTTRDTDPLNDVLTFGQPHDAPANCAEGNALDAIPLIPVESLYELLEPLGEGGMGTVTKARKRGLPRMVAVKRMQQDCRNSAVSQLRFIQEAIAVAQLKHPNIVHIEHWGRDSEGPYLILEYLSGKDLAHYVGQNGPLSAARISEIACCLCDALQHAHSRNIIHRDIKPHNLLLSEHGLVKLTDFGLVRTLTGNSELSQPGRLLGSLPYMAPEQRDDPRSADMRSDIFSLAASLYHLAVGQPPPVSMNFDFARLDPGLLGPLQTGLQSDPLRRWQSAEEFREAFLNAAVRNTVPGSVSSVPQIHRSDGQCSHCHAINPSDRLYCRGCGQSLRQPCLHCDVLIAIWERFCPQCGSNQDTLYGQLREQIEEIRQRSEQLLADYSCAETIVLVEQALSTYSHPQLSQYLLWTGSLRERAEMRQQEVQTAHVEARAIVETLADYDAAISR
ncbi:MAG: protein kinase, partial [Planctomycetaceae bacterium]|nr:protein kinase [Planctomycetaceae bacterium]